MNSERNSSGNGHKTCGWHHSIDLQNRKQDGKEEACGRLEAVSDNWSEGGGGVGVLGQQSNDRTIGMP